MSRARAIKRVLGMYLDRDSALCLSKAWLTGAARGPQAEVSGGEEPTLLVAGAHDDGEK